jgi:hypothetical protein
MRGRRLSIVAQGHQFRERGGVSQIIRRRRYCGLATSSPVRLYTLRPFYSPRTHPRGACFRIEDWALLAYAIVVVSSVSQDVEMEVFGSIRTRPQHGGEPAAGSLPNRPS